MGSGGGYLVEFSPGLEEEYTGYLEVLEAEEEKQLLTGNTPINIGILSGLLALGLTTNLLAFPVILFKRTRSLFCLPFTVLITFAAGLAMVSLQCSSSFSRWPTFSQSSSGSLVASLSRLSRCLKYICNKSPLNVKVYVIQFQVGHMAWAGDSLGYQLYYFLSSW